MTVSARTVLLVLLVVAVGAGSLLAQETPAEVNYSGDLVLRYRATCQGMSPEQRAIATRQALVEAISAVYATEDEVFDPNSVVVKAKRMKMCGCLARQIVMGDIVIAHVCPKDAKANGCCTQQLAKRWLKNIQEAIAKATHDC